MVIVGILFVFFADIDHRYGFFQAPVPLIVVALAVISIPFDRPVIMLVLIAVSLNDVFAFVIGKLVGGAKLLPAISPNKTVAGSLGAMIVTTALVAPLNALPIWRKQTRHEHLTAPRERLIDRGCVYLLFPEGTRRRDGMPAEFKSGVGALVAGTEVPKCRSCRVTSTAPSRRFRPAAAGRGRAR